MKPTRKLPRKVEAWGYNRGFAHAKEQYWKGFMDGAREADAAAVEWSPNEINAYYARTRGY